MPGWSNQPPGFRWNAAFPASRRLIPWCRLEARSGVPAALGRGRSCVSAGQQLLRPRRAGRGGEGEGRGWKTSPESGLFFLEAVFVSAVLGLPLRTCIGKSESHLGAGSFEQFPGPRPARFLVVQLWLGVTLLQCPRSQVLPVFSPGEQGLAGASTLLRKVPSCPGHRRRVVGRQQAARPTQTASVGAQDGRAVPANPGRAAL